MPKIYTLDISWLGEGLYGTNNGESKTMYFSKLYDAIQIGIQEAIDILDRELNVVATEDDFEWFGTEFGGEWLFHKKFITGFADIICTICEHQVF